VIFFNLQKFEKRTKDAVNICVEKIERGFCNARG